MSPPGKGGNRDDAAAPRKNRLPKISRTPARDWNFPPIRGSFSGPETTSRPSLMTPLTPSRLSTILLAALLVGSAGTMAFAADGGKTKAKTKVLGTFQDWKAFSYEEKGLLHLLPAQEDFSQGQGQGRRLYPRHPSPGREELRRGQHHCRLYLQEG